MLELMRRHLGETKLLITNWFLASVDDLYCRGRSQVVGLICSGDDVGVILGGRMSVENCRCNTWSEFKGKHLIYL